MTITQQQFDDLLAAARAAQANAHAPYSRFQVGAALLFPDGTIVPGCNVENASYGLTNCAERVAIGAAVARGLRKPLACVVVGPTAGPLTPCGACRQVLLEFNPAMEIICVGTNGSRAVTTAQALLPLSFGSADLDAAARGE